jgi:hypothetical protein
MARNPLQVQIELDRLHCHDEGDGIGSAEPYLWTIYFKVDGDTVALGDDLFLHGTATVKTTPGSHGNLGDTDVDAGDNISIPWAIGMFQTTLNPIPVPEWVKELGVEDVGGVAGVAAILMEEDWVTDAGAEAGHAALNQFIQQALDTIIPTLGVTNPDVDDEEIAQLTSGAEKAISNAVKDAQGRWDNFVSWLNPDDQIGNKVWTFSHDTLTANTPIALTQRWQNEGDWELFGHVTAVAPCPIEALIAILKGLGLIRDGNVRKSLDTLKKFRQKSFAGQRALGVWWNLAERNAAGITDLLRRNPDISRRSAASIIPEITKIIRDDTPISDSLVDKTTELLQAFCSKGTRRLRIDSKAALGVLPALRGKSMNQAVRVLRDRVPTRKPERLPRRELD